jgi:membrane fusion protein, heavy metal efflux system
MTPPKDRSQTTLTDGARPGRRLIGAGVALLLSTLFIWISASYAREPPPSPAAHQGLSIAQETITLSPGAPQWKALKMTRATPGVAHTTDPLPGRVQIDETRAAKVGTPLAGRVTQVFVSLGQAVRAGSPLISVASPDLAVLRAEHDKAKIALEVARINLARVRSMVEARAVPAKEETASRQELRDAEVGERLALAKIAALKVSASGPNEFTVVAAREGVVVDKRVLPAQEVAPGGEPLVVVADLRTVWVVADPSEADVTEVRERSRALVTSPSLPGVEMEGVVSMVSAVVDPDRHTIPIRVQVENPRGLLRPNLFAEVRFTVPPRQSAVDVPATALVTDGAHQYVYVEVGDGTFARREVSTGSAHDGKVPVFSGLRVDEIVVSEGAILLHNELTLAH